MFYLLKLVQPNVLLIDGSKLFFLQKMRTISHNYLDVMNVCEAFPILKTSTWRLAPTYWNSCSDWLMKITKDNKQTTITIVPESLSQNVFITLQGVQEKAGAIQFIYYVNFNGEWRIQ